MHILFLLVALAGSVLISFSAVAEEPPSNPAYDRQPGDASILRDCAKGKGRDATTCMGLISDTCAKQPSSDPEPLTLMNCWGREQAGWDQLLNERYAQLVVQAKEQDAAPGGYQERESHLTLREAQRAWIAFREAELGRFWMMRAPGLSWWRAADLEHLRLRMTAFRYIDLLEAEYGD